MLMPARGGRLLTGAAADQRGSPRGVKCSLDARTRPIYISPVSLLLPLGSLLPIAFRLGSPLSFKTGCLKHEVGPKANEQ
jgi:hypothetical protein